MARRALLVALVAFALTTGCSRPSPEPTPEAPPPPPPLPTAVTEIPAPAGDEAAPTPGGCENVEGSATLITIAEDGSATPPCVEIRKPKKTTVVWVAASPATGLKIAFKPECLGGVKPDKLPDDPACAGVTCTLDPKKYRHIQKRTEACYTVEVSFEDKPPVIVDPVLIINP